MRIRHAVLLWAMALVLCSPALAAEIHTVAGAGDLARVQALVEGDPGLVNTPDDRQCRPLQYAIDAGRMDVVVFLIDRGADLRARDVDGDTPLHSAALSGQNAAVELLLAHGADINARNNQLSTPISYAAMRNRQATVDLLAARGADLELPNDYGRTPLLLVARESGNLEMARLLLQRGANVNALDRFHDSPLSLAAWRGFRTLVALFLDSGARTDLGADMPAQLLGHAVDKGLVRLYTTLVEKGVAIDVTPRADGSLLHTAVAGGSAAIARDLIDRGARLDVTDPYGWTPLHYAAARGRTEVARLLLERGAPSDGRTRSGYTALNLAEKRGAADLVELFSARGADRAPRRFPSLSGPYLGQGEPPAEPRPFAPDIVASPHGEHGSVTFTPDGREAYWSGSTDTPDSGYTVGTILTSALVDGRWAAPQRASFAAERGDDVPFVTPDGRRLFFLSRRPLTPGQGRGAEKIWVTDRTGEGWGEPRPLPPAVNALPLHWQIAVAANGNLYFSSQPGGPETKGVYVSRPVNGEYTTPVFLGFPGETPFIAPDESYLITFEFMPTGSQNTIRFRRPDGGWGEPVCLAAGGGVCPKVSPDGRAVFFLSECAGNNNIFWMDARLIENLRRQHAAR